MIDPYLQIAQIAITVILIVSILLQGGGAGLFGGGGEAFRTKRGVEKILVYVTVLAAVAFVLTTVAGLLI